MQRGLPEGPTMQKNKDSRKCAKQQRSLGAELPLEQVTQESPHHQIMGNVIATSPTKLPLFAVQEVANLHHLFTMIRQCLLQRPQNSRSLAPQRPNAAQCMCVRVSRGCQTMSPMCMHLPRPSNKTVPMPWGVQRRPVKNLKAERERSKKNRGCVVKNDLAELVRGGSIGRGLASVFRGREASYDEGQYEGVEVAREDGNTRCVATNTRHIRVAYRRRVKKSRVKQWRREAKTWCM
ncbi:hypothetical protein E2C01_076082 [Portunus trituberculatus]|uniref:Uncharacterized protein n=1 Tax=Portunus trituberculatus TaxID=210409 RepID=A0A5B7IGX2_PORTR|nr:hypothetical protein [Portunus trituberculatus]